MPFVRVTVVGTNPSGFKVIQVGGARLWVKPDQVVSIKEQTYVIVDEVTPNGEIAYVVIGNNGALVPLSDITQMEVTE